MRATLIIIGVLGVLLFAAALSVTFLSPQTLERGAKTFIKAQIEREVREKYAQAMESDLADKAVSLASKLGMERDQIEKGLAEDLPEKIASVIADMCGYDCEKKKALTKSITSGYLDRLKNIAIAESTLGDIIKGKYLEIVGKLKTDLRIFLTSNLVMFSILLLVAAFKSAAVRHLYVPGLLLALSTTLASLLYIFGQDWFYTILYNNYWGFAYLVYLLLIFGFLLDIVLNKARITCEIFNAVADALGSSAELSPC